MSNKIGASTPAALGLVGTVKGAADRPTSTSTASASPAAPVDTVRLTGNAVHLHQLDQAGANSPDFDEQRVAKARAAIGSGNYPIDAREIAARLTRMDWDLSGK